MSEAIYGIDLGTTNSCLSVLENGRPRVIPVDDTGVVPSVISLDGGKILAGRKALNRSLAFPEFSCRSVKRLMGSETKVVLGKKEFRPEQISGHILGYLISEAKKLEGRSVKKAVITVPAYFSDAQRRATREAGQLAGLEVARLINEPTAAALFYDLVNVGDKASDSPVTDWKHALVYDLGGGTFDVSVLRLGDIIEILASTGDTNLGGDDFDSLIAGLLVESIQEHGGPDVSSYPPAMARIRFAAEEAKRKLSELGTVMVEEPSIPTGSGGATASLSMELTRTALETLTEKLIERTIDLVDDALKESRLIPRDIDRVILVGGMTRMPIITQELSKIFGNAQLPAVDPDLSVAHGAAVQGGIITGENPDQILVDVAAHSLSLVALDEDELKCTIIIPRNTAIPTKRARVFYTMVHNQEIVQLRIYQGESEDPGKNKLIGHKILHLAPAERQCPIEVEYSYDLNGIIHVVAKQRGYGRKVELEIDSRNPDLNSQQNLFSQDAHIKGVGGHAKDEVAVDDDDDQPSGGGDGDHEQGESFQGGQDDDYGEDEKWADENGEEGDEGDGEEGDEDDDDDDSGRRINLVIRRAESILASNPSGQPELEALASALELYRQALETSDDEALIDQLEDKLMSLIESRD